MRTYFIRVPNWVRVVYPSAVWTRDTARDNNDHLHITIDDGPHPTSTHKWLDLLRETNQSATFFLLGSAAKSYSSIVAEIRSEGHEVASHGMDHKDGWRVSRSSYIDQVFQSLDVLECTRYRPPYGRLTPNQYLAIKDKCDIYMWSMMSGDFDADASESDILVRLKGKKDSDIMVFHDSPSAIAKVKRPILSLFS